MIILLLLGLVASSPLTKELIQMQISQASYDDVLSALNELLGDLQRDQGADDIQQAQLLAKLEADIIILQNQLEIQQSQLKNTNLLWADLSDEVAIISKTLANLRSQLSQVGDKDQQLREAIKFEEDLYEKTQSSAQKQISALEQIVQKLSNAVLSQSFLQKQEILTQMKSELGAQNPLTLLVEVTSKFDQNTVKKIILKLENIISDQQQGQVQAEQQLQLSQQNAQTLLFQYQDLQKRLAFDITTSQSQLSKKNNEKSIAENRKESLEISIPLAEELLQNTKKQQQAYEQTYSQRKQSRQDEIKTLQEAYQILSKK